MKQGFLTLEMMIAMALMVMMLSVVILSIFGNQNFLIGGQTNSEAMNKAQELLEQEQARARKDYQSVVPILPTTDDIYKKWVTVESSSNPTDYFTKKVTSFVSWTDDSTITRTTKLTTLITDFANAVGGNTCNSFLTGNWASPQIKNSNTNFASLVGDSSGTYPITDIDVYQGKLYATVNTPSITTPLTNPSVGNDDITNGGSIAWTNSNNITSPDNSTAKATLIGAAQTHYIKATGFNFSIPQGATILGITVKVERFTNSGSSGNGIDSHVKILKNGSMVGSTDQPASTNWPTSNGTYQTYGGATDLWGLQWSPSDINSSNFGVAFAAQGTTGSTNRVANIDNIQISVTYIKEFYVFNVTNSNNPTFMYGLGSSAIANGLNAVTTNGNFAYVATGSATGQLQIIDLGVNPPVATSTLKIGTSGTSVGNTLFYKNGYIYIGLSNTAGGPPEFAIIDVHNPINPSLVGSYSVGSGVNSIVVRNNTAYITTSDTTKEFIKLDISNPTAPVVKSTYNALPDQSGFGYGRSEYVVGDNVYIGRTYIASAPEFVALDASTTAPLLLQTKDIGPNSANPYSLNGIIVRDTLAFLLLGSGSKGGQLHIVNATSSVQYATPISLPSLSGSTGTGGTSIDCEGNTLYISSVDSSNKGYISIIAP